MSDLTFFLLGSAAGGFVITASAAGADNFDCSSLSFCMPKSSDISGSTQPDIGICDTWLAAAPSKTETGSDATPKSGVCTISPASPDVRLVVFFSFIEGELG